MPYFRLCCLRAAMTLVATLVIGAGTAFAGNYRLQQGDLLELVVVPPLELREEMRIDVDGNITVPLVGAVRAEGLKVEDVATAVRGRLAAASLPPMGPGEILPVQLWPSAISLSLKEYRPIYVSGDVRAEGAFAFAPGLTARRAIALAGGYGLARLLGGDPVLQRLELQAELGELAAARAGALARIDRLRRELATIAPEALEADGVAPPAGPVAAAEQAILAVRRDQDATAAHHFDSAIREAEEQISGLKAQLATETEGMTADQQDYDRLRDMRADGTVTAIRLTDARRALLYSTTRQLETASELVRTRRDLGDVAFQRERQRQDLRLEAVRELADQTRKIAELDIRIAGAARRNAYLGSVAPDNASIAISITGSDGSLAELASGQDRPLRPGDLVVVSVSPGGRPESDPPLPAPEQRERW